MVAHCHQHNAQQRLCTPIDLQRHCRWRPHVRARVQHHHQGQPHQQTALLYDFHDQQIPYEQAWEWQKRCVAALCDSYAAEDAVFLLQHPPVFTLGAGSSEQHVKFDLQQPPHPLYRTERGGEVTYHGPGQLVMYPILNLHRHVQDLHWYLRGLEEVVIRALAATSGLEGQRIEGLTGVWVDGHKLAAIGVRARKWVTYHGLALNVTTDLSPFKLITPCGISDRPVGSVTTALSQHTAAGSSSSDGHNAMSVAQLQAVVRHPLITEYRFALVEAMEEVFGLQLHTASAEQMQQLLQQGGHQGGSQDSGTDLGPAAAVVGAAAAPRDIATEVW